MRRPYGATKTDPYGDMRPTHLARAIGEGGRIWPWCFATPRALHRRARYVMYPQPGITCKKCRDAYNLSERKQGELPEGTLP